MDICAISNNSRVWSLRGEMRLVTRRTFLSRGTGAVAPIFDSDESRPPITKRRCSETMTGYYDLLMAPVWVLHDERNIAPPQEEHHADSSCAIRS